MVCCGTLDGIRSWAHLRMHRELVCRAVLAQHRWQEHHWLRELLPWRKFQPRLQDQVDPWPGCQNALVSHRLSRHQRPHLHLQVAAALATTAGCLLAEAVAVHCPRQQMVPCLHPKLLQTSGLCLLLPRRLATCSAATSGLLGEAS